MNRANGIIIGFDTQFGSMILERAFQGIEMNNCIIISNHQKYLPHLHVQNQHWMPAAKLREGKYDIDWNDIAPLDEELIEKMRHSESVYLELITRFEKKSFLTYQERKRRYLQDLRYWSHVLDKNKISFFLSCCIPHQCYDIVIYDLCKMRNIPTLFVNSGVVVDTFFLIEDWQKSVVEIGERYHENKSKYQDGENVELSEKFEEYYRSQTCKEKNPKAWYHDIYTLPHVAERRVVDWARLFYRLFTRKPINLLKMLFSISYWNLKFNQYKTYRYYEKHVIEPDLEKNYVYVPLHSQPECSTSPMGGVFTDQQLLVQLLSECLPPDVIIYIKEHPAQQERCRNIEFYKDLLAVSRVRFVPRHFSSFKLIEFAKAVATCTGTAGFEALFREKPLFMFGHRFFQYAPGVFPIHSLDDCERAVHAVFSENAKPLLSDIRLFLKAYEEVSIHGYYAPTLAQFSNVTYEENIARASAALKSRLLSWKHIFPSI